MPTENPTGEKLTKESLFPPGVKQELIPPWKQEEQKMTDASSEAPSEETEETAEAPDAAAEAQDTSEADEQITDEEQELQQSDETADSMRLYDFAKQAGWKLDEFYSGVTVPIDGQDVPIGQALNDIKSVREANEALLRERQELREKAQKSAAEMPVAQQSPDAMALMAQAQMYRQQLQGIMQAEQNDPNLVNDPGVASQKVNIDYTIRSLEQQAAQKQMEYDKGLQEQIRKTFEERDMQTRARIKEWNDPNVRQAEWTAISDELKADGVDNVDINQVPPNMRAFLRRAWRAIAAEKRIKEGPKTIRKVGKVLPASARVSHVKPKPDRTALSQKIRDTKNPEEAMKLRLTAEL